jgi:hypothetical protein
VSETTRVYVNGRGVDVAPGSTYLDAVRVFDEGLARQVASGERALADSRGLPVAATEPAYAGAIVRVVSGRRGRDAEGA